MTRTLAGGLAFTAAATLAFVPQMLAWKAIYGHYLAVSPVGPAIYWGHPQLVAILWSSRNGLFAMSPVLYVAAAGLVIVARRRPAIGVPALVAVALMIYFNACIQDWWGSAGFGGRRFDGVLPLLAVGLAAAIDAGRRAVTRHPRLAASTALVALIAWNLTLRAATASGAVPPPGTPRSFGDVAAAQARTAARLIGHPFSYPANLVYAARNGVPPGDYDLVAPLSFLGDPIRPYGRIDLATADDVFLLDGWHAPEREGDATFRWARPAGGSDRPAQLHRRSRFADQDPRLRPDRPAAAARDDRHRTRDVRAAPRHA
jgi:hypothetical protein